MSKSIDLKCSGCGFEYIHPVKVEVIGERTTTITNQGIEDKVSQELPGRGVQIRITFQCEDGCEYDHSYHFYKGNTTLVVTKHGKYEEQLETIWRD
jgi:hypothetical protein